jgi:hypothetical protein
MKLLKAKFKPRDTSPSGAELTEWAKANKGLELKVTDFYHTDYKDHRYFGETLYTIMGCVGVMQQEQDMPTWIAEGDLEFL